MAAELWAVRLEHPLTEQETEHLLLRLPFQRRERLLRLRQAESRREPLCAYALLELALRERYHWRAWPEIAVTDRGKPFFPAYPSVHFSLSHTTGAVLVGVADRPIGVDIEKIRPVSRRMMSRLAETDSRETFFRSWVRREARTKRSGEGVSAMLHTEPPMQQGEFYHELELFPGYAAGAATGDPIPPGTPRICTLEELL